MRHLVLPHLHVMEACSAGVKGRPAGPDRGRGCGTATAAAAAAGRIAATACLDLLLSAELDEGGGRRPSPETGTNVAGRGLFLRGPRDDGEAAGAGRWCRRCGGWGWW